jgi:hypothetical protein
MELDPGSTPGTTELLGSPSSEERHFKGGQNES